MSFKNKFIFFALLYTFLPFNLGSWMITKCGYHQISALNKFLEELIENPVIATPDIIKNVTIIHDKICDLFVSISAFYVFIHMLIISSITYFFVFTTYSTFVYTKYPSQELIDFTMTVSSWCFYIGPFGLSLFALSSLTQSEGNKTANLVEQLANKTGKIKMVKSSYILALQVRHRRAKITCGLYDIDWKVLFSVLGSVYSYSVIMIQFHDVLKN